MGRGVLGFLGWLFDYGEGFRRNWIISRREILRLAGLLSVSSAAAQAIPVLAGEPEEYDAQAQVYGLGFVGELNNLEDLASTEFVQGYPELQIRARQVSGGNIGEVVSNVAAPDNLNVHTLNIDVGSNSGSIDVIFEAGYLNESGDFEVAPLVSQQIMTQYALRNNVREEDKLHMTTVNQEVVIDGQTYLMPRQVWTVDESWQPSEEGVPLETYTDFVYFKLEPHHLEKIQEHAKNYESTPPPDDLIQWLAITSDEDTYICDEEPPAYTLLAGQTLSITDTTKNAHVTRYSNRLNVWNFHETAVDKDNPLTAQFGCPPAAEYPHDKDHMPQYPESMFPKIPINNGLTGVATIVLP